MLFDRLEPFGVKLSGFRAADASESDLQVFEQLFREHSLVVITDPALTPDQQVALLARLGPVAIEFPGQDAVSYIAHDPAKRVDVDEGGGDFGLGELAFHQDMSYTEDWPTWIISLYCELATRTGGETRLVHSGRVYDKLDQQIKDRIAGKRAVHILDQEKRLLATREADCGAYALRGVHDIVWDHPYGFGKVLTVAETDTDRIVGMPTDEGRELLQVLFDALADPAETLDYRWKVGDLLVWDNRTVMHARAEFDPAEARRLRRVAVGDGRSILLKLQNRMEQLFDMTFPATPVVNAVPGTYAMTEIGVRGGRA